MAKSPRSRDELKLQQVAAKERRDAANLVKCGTRAEQLFERFGHTNRQMIASETRTNYRPVRTLKRRDGGGVVHDYCQRTQPRPEDRI